jgi:predicted RNase H-like HicB family nuclease
MAGVAATKPRTFSLVVVRDGDGYSVEVPAVPGCFSQGRPVEEAVEHAREAIRLHVRAMEADGEPVPDGAEHSPYLTMVSV